MGFSTDAIHAGQIPDPTTGAVITPIYQTSTYAQEELGVSKGFDYGRTINPTRVALEANIAALEKGKYGFAFGSGMAAITNIAALLNGGDHVIVSNNVYGGTFRFFDKIMKRFGLEFSWVDTSDEKNIRAAIKPNTKMLYVETPTNPMLTITDLQVVAALAKEHKLISVVDNTFMSPYFQTPLEFGVDIVLHSTTKYINGHSDVIGGVVVTSSEELKEKLKFLQNSIGAVPSPFDCWLVLRSTKTLALRMRQHNENAIAMAEFLAKHPKVKKIYYPGLASHPQHALAKKQMRGFGGMISIELGSMDAGKNMLRNVKIFALAESLGGVESLICHPASMTHGAIPLEDRLKLGLTDGLVRLSVGCEDKEDLIADIENALKAV
ncbi:MAG TPA: cystathionine gamma-synthase [bacterium]|nr:cystathionine gamma-synthase [bacterium]HNB10003.1 cystathionine gamma-synthase [bacterium]HNC47936.1 cystathionine gamma-synthase [bacterium]HND76367.1 cystathionine gamma-synthase [bacterium]HNH28120.1 cystathionine gamma-synthase [bacterium]